MIIILLLKGGGDYRGIGLLDPIWKVVEKVMVAQLSVIKLHDCLHGKLPRRGTGTAIMEVKLQQQLAWVDQEPLYQIYLDLRKAYDALDWGKMPRDLGRVRCWAKFALPSDYIARVIIMIYLLRLIVESHRGGLFPASCSMCVSTVS